MDLVFWIGALVLGYLLGSFKASIETEIEKELDTLHAANKKTGRKKPV